MRVRHVCGSEVPERPLLDLDPGNDVSPQGAPGVGGGD